MIANRAESRNFNATSTINDETVMYMNASYSTNGDLNYNQSIQNMILYKAHKEQVDEDYETWKNEVYNKIFNENKK